MDWIRKYLDRNRGIQHDGFSQTLQNVAKASEDCCRTNTIEKTPGTDIADPYASVLKPKGVPVWDHVPSDEVEEALYYGVHIHSESNPLGLHTHVPGGILGGGHTHGPQNRVGSHSHKKLEPNKSMQIDGAHTHCENHLDGDHFHVPENFA